MSNGEAAARYPAITVERLQEALGEQLYVGDRGLVMSLFLALRLGKPLLLEGEAGIGKTEVAKALASILGARLIRLQCYEGLDVSSAVYEWNYARQMLEIRLLEARDEAAAAGLRDIFGPDFLIARPLLQAISHQEATPPVLLIDELDRADAEFEAFLLEVLSDFQVSIPELGTIRATAPPVVILTSNRTREIHDALKRRCLYHWIDYPTLEKERRIVALKVPEAADRLAGQVCRMVQTLRGMDLYKAPGVSETLDWVRALVALGRQEVDVATVDATLGCVLKYEEDLHRLSGSEAASLATAVAGDTSRAGRNDEPADGARQG